MGTDLTGGLGDDREFVFAEQPENPEMRESVNAWIWDRGTEIGLPRIGIEAVADQWDTHDIQVNIGTADGRVFNVFGTGEVHDPLGADGKPRVLGAGPLSFELVEPFRKWTMRLDGLTVESTVAEQIAGESRHGPERAGRDRDRHRSGRSTVGERRVAARGEARARRAGRRRVDGRPALRAVVTRDRHPRGSATPSTASTAARCACVARACAGSAPSEATRGSRRCSRADAASATSSIRTATTTCPPTTRATSSTVTAS